MITDENKKIIIITSICEFFDWQFSATIDTVIARV